MQTNPSTPAPPNNAFEKTLREMRHGKTLAELSLELSRLIEAVKHTGKPGVLDYKIKVKPASEGDAVTVQLDDDINVKMPRLPRGSSIFFVNENNELQRNDPRQREFAITAVPAPAAPVNTTTAVMAVNA